jgi:hypothetical protein
MIMNRMNNKGRILGIAVFSLILLGLIWLLVTQSIIPIAQELKSPVTGSIVSEELSAPEQKAAAINEIKTNTKTIEMNGNDIAVSVNSHGNSDSNINYDDGKLVIERQGKTIEFSGIENNEGVNIGFDDNIESSEFVNMYAIDPSKVKFEKATVKVIAKGNELLKCKDWNFTEQKCYGQWIKLMDIVPGQEYSFTLTADDPGFGEINATAAYHLDENYSFISDIFAQIEHRDNVWSEPIPENHTVRVTYQRNMTNGNVIDVYYRSNNSGYFEVYYPDTTNPRLGVSNNAAVEGSWAYISLSNMPSISDVFDFRIFGSPIEFDYIHDDDTTPPEINWANPTPSDGNTTANNWVYLNTTITDASSTSAFFDWNNSLMGYWAMDFYNSTGIYDNSSYSNFGTFNGGMNTSNINTTGRFGKALDFDGSNDYIDCGNMAHFERTQPFSVEFWMYWDVSGTHSVVSNLDNTASTRGWEAILEGSVIHLRLSNTWVTNMLDVSATHGMSTATWNHVVMTYNGTNSSSGINIFINGVKKSASTVYNSLSGTIVNNTQTLRVGGRGWGSNYFNGKLDEVKIYDRVLSSSEINASYNNSANRLYRNFTDLNNGNYTYSAYAIDAFGNLAKTSARNVNVYSDTAPPSSISNLQNQSAGGTWIYWNWTNPGDSDFSQAIVYINGSNVANTSNNYYTATGLSPETEYTITVHTKDINGNVNNTNVSSVAQTTNAIPPSSVTDLQSQSAGSTWIYWNWTNPADADFNHTEVWINGIFKSNVSAPANYYNATGLNASTNYTIQTRTVDHVGNINTTWVNNTAATITVVDITAPAINWELPTPNDSNITYTNNWVYLNTTITDASSTSAFFDWNNSLIGYWAMDFYNSTGIYDNSSYSNFGTFNGGMNTSNINTTGRFGSSLDFDGSNDYIDCGNMAHFERTQPFSVEFWMNWDAPGTHVIVSNLDIAASHRGWEAILEGSVIHLRLSNTWVTNMLDVYATHGMSTATWNHVVMTYNGTSSPSGINIYINGVKKSAVALYNNLSGTIVNNARTLRVGGRGWGSGSNYFNGKLDEVRVYNRVLSSEEISASYNNTANRLYHNFTNLDKGNYPYTAYAIDAFGNLAKNSRSVRKLGGDIYANRTWFMEGGIAGIYGMNFNANDTLKLDITLNGSSIGGYPKNVTTNSGGNFTDYWIIPEIQATDSYWVSAASYNESNFNGTFKLTINDYTNLTFSKIKEDGTYSAIFDNIEQAGNNLFIMFHHDSPSAKNIRIVGNINYSLSTDLLSASEYGNLTVYDYSGQYFRIQVGNHTDAFSFGIPGNFSFNGVMQDAEGNNISSEITIIDTLLENITYDSTSAVHNTTLPESEYDLIIQPINHTIKQIAYNNVYLSENITKLIYIDEANSTGNLVEMYALDPTSASLQMNATVSVTASGNSLFKCKEWNFTEQTCNGRWKKIQNIEPGSEYSFTLTAEDPGFGEGNYTVELLDENNYLDSYNETILRNENNISDVDLQIFSGTVSEIVIYGLNESTDNKILKLKHSTNEDYLQSYSIDPTNLSFDNATVTVTAQGTDLYKCKNWNFSSQTCIDGNWTLFKTGLVPGQEYTFTLTADDPGFGENATGSPSAEPAFFMMDSFGASDRGTDAGEFDECPIQLNDYGETTEKCTAWDCTAWTNGSTTTQSYSCSGGWNCTDWNGVTCSQYKCEGWAASGTNRAAKYCSGVYDCTLWNGDYCQNWNCTAWTLGSADSDNYCSGLYDCVSWNGNSCDRWNCTAWSNTTAAKTDKYCSGLYDCVSWNGGNSCDSWNCTAWTSGTAQKDMYCSGNWNCSSWNGNICDNWQCLGWTTGATSEYDYYCDNWNCSSWDATKNVCSNWNCLQWLNTGATDKDAYCSGVWNCTQGITISSTAPTVSLVAPADNHTETNTLNLNFTYTVSDYAKNVTNCTIYISDIISQELIYNYTNTSITKNINQSFNYSFTYNGNYHWNVSCTDSNNSKGWSENRNLTLNIAGVQANVAPSFEGQNFTIWGVNASLNWNNGTLICSGILNDTDSAISNCGNGKITGGRAYRIQFSYGCADTCTIRRNTATDSVEHRNVNGTGAIFGTNPVLGKCGVMDYGSNDGTVTCSLSWRGNNVTILNTGAAHWIVLTEGEGFMYNITAGTNAMTNDTSQVYAAPGNKPQTSGKINISVGIIPAINLTYPLNQSYNINVSALNYTVSDAQACWYSLNLGVTNTTISNCANVTGLTSTEGSNTWKVYANSSSGDQNTSSVTFFKDTIAPSINFTSPTEISGSYVNRLYILVNVTANDTGGLQNITTYWYNSSRDVVGTRGTTTSPQYTNQTNGITKDGIYYFNSTACDKTNNCNSTETRNVTIDTIAPSISMAYPANQSYNINVSALNYTVSDAQACWYSLNLGVTNTTASSCANLTGLASTEGNNTWKIYANDSAGNQNSSSVTFFKDTIAPVITITSPLNQTYTTNQILVNFTADSYQALWFNNETANVSAHETYVNVSQGSHTFIFYANDSVGNLNQTSRTFNINLVPSWSSPSKNETAVYNGMSINFNATWTDLDLAGYIFAINQTGNWINSSFNAFTASNVSENISVISANAGTNVSWYFWANDSIGSSNQTSMQSFVVQEIPSSLQFSVNQTLYPHSRIPGTGFDVYIPFQARYLDNSGQPVLDANCTVSNDKSVEIVSLSYNAGTGNYTGQINDFYTTGDVTFTVNCSKSNHASASNITNTKVWWMDYLTENGNISYGFGTPSYTEHWVNKIPPTGAVYVYERILNASSGSGESNEVITFIHDGPGLNNSLTSNWLFFGNYTVRMNISVSNDSCQPYICRDVLDSFLNEIYETCSPSFSIPENIPTMVEYNGTASFSAQANQYFNFEVLLNCSSDVNNQEVKLYYNYTGQQPNIEMKQFSSMVFSVLQRLQLDASYYIGPNSMINSNRKTVLQFNNTTPQSESFEFIFSPSILSQYSNSIMPNTTIVYNSTNGLLASDNASLAAPKIAYIDNLNQIRWATETIAANSAANESVQMILANAIRDNETLITNTSSEITWKISLLSILTESAPMTNITAWTNYSAYGANDYFAFTVTYYNVTGSYDITSQTAINTSADTLTFPITPLDSNGIDYVITAIAPVTPEVHIISPSNATLTNVAQQNFICNITAPETNVTSFSWNLSLHIWNSTSLYSVNSSQLTGISNQSTSSYMLPDGNYTWNCLGVNQNKFNWSAEGNYSLTIKAAKPQIQFISPTPDSGIFQQSSSFTIKAESNDSYIASIEIKVYDQSGAVKDSGSSNNNPVATLDTSLSDGLYFFNATAHDSLGNYNSTETRNITIDYVSPSMTNIETSPALPLYNNGLGRNISVSFTSSEFPINITFTLYNSSGSIEYSQETTLHTSANLPVNFTLPALSAGTYSLNMTAKDPALNSNTTALGEIIIDTTNPSVTLVYPLNQSYITDVIDLNYIVSDTNLQSCWYSLNFGVTNTTIPGCANLTGLTSVEGSNTWKVYANDSAGNQNSSTVTFFKDSLNPQINITYPLNQNYNVNVSKLNYTASDASLNTCWYSLNLGVTNVTISNCANLTGLTSAEGSNIWKVYANDSLGNQNSSSVTFFKDTVIPLIQFASPTTETGNYSQNSISANVTASDINLQIVTIYLYNSSGLVTSAASTSTDFTNLADGTYYLNATVTDISGNINATETRTILLDTTLPVPAFVNPSETSGSYINRTNIKVNISVTEVNFKNTTIRLYNSTSLINTTFSTSQVSFVEFTSIQGMNYFNATSCDIVNQCAQTETRSVIIDLSMPTFTNQTRPSPGSPIAEFASVQLKANATDNNAISNVSANVTWNSGSQLVQLSYNTGTGLYESTFAGTAGLGLYNVTFTAIDVAGNSNTTKTNFTVYDAISPVITYTNISSYAVIVNETVTIDMASADENPGSNFINITFPNGTTATYYSLPVNFNSSLIGRYNITFMANDTSGNTASQDDYFIIGSSQTVQFNVIDSNLTGIDNILTIYLANTNKTVHSHEFTGIYLDEHAQTDYDLLFKAYNASIAVKLRNINLTLDYNSTLGIDKPAVSGFLVTYGINSTYTISNATLTLNYSSLSYHEDYLSVYRCANWSFENRTCNSDWQLISASQDKTSHVFNVNVSGFSGYSIQDSYVAPSPSAPSAGGGGGGIYKECIENWMCTAWSCSDGTASRTCTDLNQCGTIKYKPAESEECAKTGCFNNIKDGAETDVDCGGVCVKCAIGKKCMANKDCVTGICNGTCIISEQAKPGEKPAEEKPVSAQVICWWIWAEVLITVLAMLLLINLIDLITKPSFQEKVHEYIRTKKEVGILRPELRKVKAEEFRTRHPALRPEKEVRRFSENLIKLINRKVFEPEIKAIKNEISRAEKGISDEAEAIRQGIRTGISSARHEAIVKPEGRIRRFIAREEEALKEDVRKIKAGIKYDAEALRQARYGLSSKADAIRHGIRGGIKHDIKAVEKGISGEAEAIRGGIREEISSARHEAIIKPELKIKRFIAREEEALKEDVRKIKSGIKYDIKAVEKGISHDAEALRQARYGISSKADAIRHGIRDGIKYDIEKVEKGVGYGISAAEQEAIIKPESKIKKLSRNLAKQIKSVFIKPKTFGQELDEELAEEDRLAEEKVKKEEKQKIISEISKREAARTKPIPHAKIIVEYIEEKKPLQQEEKEKVYPKVIVIDSRKKDDLAAQQTETTSAQIQQEKEEIKSYPKVIITESEKNMDLTAQQQRPIKIRTRVERLEEESRKQQELEKKQQEALVERARMLKRYIISRAAEQESSKTEADVRLGSSKIEKPEEEKIDEPASTDSENILTTLNKLQIKPGKKKLIKHYMLDKLKEAY